MNYKALLLTIAPLFAFASNAQEAKQIEKKAFPAEIINRITTYESISKDEISSLEDGVIRWGDSNYIGALINKSQNECRIYTYSREGDIAALSLYPDCKFIDGVKLSHARKKEMPDIIFKMSLSSGNISGPVEHYVVAVFDDQKGKYCESQSIAAWYQIGILSNIPETFDISCPASTNKNRVELKLNDPHNPSTIVACKDDQCAPVSLPQLLINDIKDGYSELSIDYITSSSHPELVATNAVEGSINRCSVVYQYNENSGTLSRLEIKPGPICNYKKYQDYLVSSYRDGAKWFEDIYRISQGGIKIELSDSCVGCEQVSRVFHKDGSKLLVSDAENFMERKLLTSEVTVERAPLYSRPEEKARTKMYLIKNDKVTLLDYSAPDSGECWYLTRYKTATEKNIEKWLKCEHLKTKK